MLILFRRQCVWVSNRLVISAYGVIQTCFQWYFDKKDTLCRDNPDKKTWQAYMVLLFSPSTILLRLRGSFCNMLGLSNSVFSRQILRFSKQNTQNRTPKLRKPLNEKIVYYKSIKGPLKIHNYSHNMIYFQP